MNWPVIDPLASSRYLNNKSQLFVLPSIVFLLTRRVRQPLPAINANFTVSSSSSRRLPQYRELKSHSIHTGRIIGVYLTGQTVPSTSTLMWRNKSLLRVIRNLIEYFGRDNNNRLESLLPLHFRPFLVHGDVISYRLGIIRRKSRISHPLNCLSWPISVNEFDILLLILANWLLVDRVDGRRAFCSTFYLATHPAPLFAVVRWFLESKANSTPSVLCTLSAILHWTACVSN